MKSLTQKIKTIFIKYKRVIIILGMISLFVLFISNRNSKKDENWTEYTVTKQTLSKTINETGTVSGEKVRELTFGSVGIVGEVFVQIGDYVEAGTPIATLDTTIFKAQLQSARGDLTAANANLAKAKDQSTIQMQENALEIANIDKELADTEIRRAIEVGTNNEELASLQVDIAEITLDYVEDDETAQAITVSEANEDLQATNSPEAENLAEEQTELTRIQSDKNEAIQEILTNQSRITLQNTLLNTDSSVDRAETTLEKLQRQSNNAEIQLAQIKNFNQQDINALSGQWNRAKGASDIAQYNLDHAVIKAPFNGTVLDIPFETDEQYQGAGVSGVVLFADMSKLKAEVNVNELDILDITKGQKAYVNIDGLYNETFEGIVSKIHPGPKNFDGLVSYQVDIDFDSNEYNILQGMTANIDFVLEEKEEILTIPMIALKSENGKYLVKIKSGETLKEIEVITGIQGESDIEIISGLKEGDIVIY